MFNLQKAGSVDEFVTEIAHALELKENLRSVGNIRDLFPPGFYRFLDFVHANGTIEEKTAIKPELISKRSKVAHYSTAWSKVAESAGNVTTLVFDVYQNPPKRRSKKFEHDPILLWVYESLKYYDPSRLISLRKEHFGEKGIDLRKANESTLKEIGMVNRGCHAFPLTPSQRPVYMWMDTSAPHFKRHSLYLNGTSQRVGYLVIENSVFRTLSTKINPNFIGVEKLSS